MEDSELAKLKFISIKRLTQDKPCCSWYGVIEGGRGGSPGRPMFIRYRNGHLVVKLGVCPIGDREEADCLDEAKGGTVILVKPIGPTNDNSMGSATMVSNIVIPFTGTVEELP